MSSNKNYFDLIDSYLNGEMNQGQINEFENQLRKDPLLENEFQLQKDIVDSIKHFRHAELKATLDAVEVGGTAFSAVKIAAGIGLLVLFGAGLFYFGSIDNTGDENQTAIEQPIESPAKPAENLSNADVKTDAQQLVEDNSTDVVVVDDNKTQEIAIEEQEVVNHEPEQQNPELTEAPNITLPEVVENFNETNDNQIAENIKVPVNKMQQATETYIPKTAVVEMDNSNYAFHYQFYDNKLYLYGVFENKYEILELNTPNGISIYMYYNAQFYELQQNQEKITPLESIKDNALIEDLRTIKEN